MHPAISIIFFTTASGAGYGLLALSGVLAPLGLLPAERGFGAAALALGLVLVTAGLLSSTFHLGHPERAWRAVTQWRSSWLSREGVAALLTYLPVLLFALGWVWFERIDGIWALFGLLGTLGAALTVYCTAMIYRSLKAIPDWHNIWVPAVYMLFALATGAVWLNLLAHLFGVPRAPLDALAMAAVVLAWAAKGAYWRAIDGAVPTATAESATGLGALGKVRLLESPNTEVNYLMQEMGYRIARKHRARLRQLVHGIGFAAALVLTGLAWLAPSALGGFAALLAALAISFGVVVERWLFFAEARHVVQLYYGESTV